MSKFLFSLSFLVLLCGCKVTEPPAYQADREPEDRNQYHGLEGLAQYQKDQRYLLDKELSDKCSAARIDYAVAESQGDKENMEKQADIISDSCKS